MLAIVGSLLSRVASGVLAPLFGFLTSKDANNLAGYTAGAAVDKDIAVASLQAQVQIEQTKATVNMWLGFRIVTLGFATLMLIHLGAVVFDSMPLFGHAVGSWAVAALPGPMASWEGTIILSFFALPVVAPPLQALTSWLHRA